MKRANPFDAHAIDRQHYSSLLAGHYRMRRAYHIRRPRGTQDWLLFMTAAGGGVFAAPAGAAAADANAMFLYPPGVTHDYCTDPRTGLWDFYWIHFRPPAVWLPFLSWPEAAAPGLRRFALAVLPPIERRRVKALVQDTVRHALSFTPLGDAFAMNTLESVLLRCYRGLSAPAQSVFAEEVRSHILLHPQDDLSVAALAAREHLSPSRFAFRFRKEFGTTPQAFVEDARLEMAKRLLAAHHGQIKEVALNVGFGDPLYFSKRFKRRYGAPPHVMFPD